MEASKQDHGQTNPKGWWPIEINCPHEIIAQTSVSKWFWEKTLYEWMMQEWYEWVFGTWFLGCYM